MISAALAGSGFEDDVQIAAAVTAAVDPSETGGGSTSECSICFSIEQNIPARRAIDIVGQPTLGKGIHF